MSRNSYRLTLGSIAIVAVCIFGWLAYQVYGPQWVYSRNGTERHDLQSDHREVKDHGSWREEYSDEFYPIPAQVKKRQ